jgi:hypothetical protein
VRTDTVTLIRSGEVPLYILARAIQRFSALIKGLSIDTGAEDLDWILNDLQVSSAVATVLGRGEAEKIARVVRGYESVGSALERDEPIPYSPRVQRPARALRSIVGGKIESVTLETAEREAIIRPSRPRAAVTPLPGQPVLRAVQPLVAGRVPAFGAVDGRVQTLSNRGGLRFTLYDLLHDKAVSCYLAEGHEEIMRDVWGKVATVEGLITREPLSGRPLAVRQIAKVTPTPDFKTTYRDARGAAPSLTGILPEHAIRRLRDA